VAVTALDHGRARLVCDFGAGAVQGMKIDVAGARAVQRRQFKGSAHNTRDCVFLDSIMTISANELLED
jgi:hypothetical protein